jgi:hypothetical protein
MNLEKERQTKIWRSLKNSLTLLYPKDKEDQGVKVTGFDFFLLPPFIKEKLSPYCSLVFFLSDVHHRRLFCFCLIYFSDSR